MDLSRREYPAMLDSLEPAQAVAVLNQRLKHISKVNSDVADFLQERRRLEDAYAQGLRKLTARQPLDSGADLGVFSMPWTKIVSATEALAESHHSFAAKLEHDVERTLRDFEKSNREMQTMSTISGNMAAMAKEIEASQKRADKLKGKGEKAPAGKVASATSDVENALQQWNSQAPYVYEQLQAVDESRINHLRDALTQFQTLELDQIDRTRAPTEQCLSLILDVQTADEVKMFALKTTDGKAKIERTTSRTPGQSSAVQTPSMQPPPTPDDGSSQRSGSGRPPALSHLSPEPRSPSTVHEQKLGGLSGLKRLGTVLGRRKSAVPYARATSPDRRSTANFGSAFSSFGSRVSKSRDADHRPSSPSRLAESQIPSSPSASESMVSPGRTVPERTNGIPPVPEHQPIPESEVVNGGLNVGIPQLQEPLQPTSSVVVPPEPQKDAEGYSMPGSSTTSDLFSQAEAEAAGENVPPQFKVDIRNAPIQEEDSGDAQAAMANVANTLRMQTAPAKRSGTTRGRRDVRNTIFVPSPQATEMPPFPDPVSMPPVPPVPTASSSGSPVTAPTSPPSGRPQSPLRPNSHRLNLGDEPPASDTQSIRSGRSLSSAHSHTVKHPDLHEPGLNSSIVETVSAWFEQGNLTRAVVIGELALAYNPVDLSVPFGNETIRLDNFPVLEKVAPNPTFIDQVQARAGDYTVNLSSITRTQVGFKYQVHLDDSNVASFAPISLSTAWKVEPTQTSVILTYSLNPAFKLAPGRTSINLNNVVLVIHLDPTGAKCAHCQSKPVGTFSKDRNLIYWRLGVVTLSSDQPAQQLRARFYTEGEAKPGNAEARWEISGEQAVGQGSGLEVSQMVPPSGENADAEADPFADDSGPSSSTAAAAATWKPVATVKKITSGTYTAV
ncbi:Muniscin C-terminal mu homology domain-containing protein [Phyllosticta paracitricarpa]|uniref:Muniscin C-terminal mu homology domain-containing protein n=1 Tax=Phyllosticta paracitricarpa TaxID=2016321 RepID=A0ABR1NHH1_9PEZI